MTSLESRIRGAALGALRRLKRWPGLRLAEAVGTSDAMVSHYETGSKELSPERFFEMGRAMGYSRRRLEAARFGLGVSLRELESEEHDESAAAGHGAAARSEGEALSRRLAAEMAGLAASRTIDRALQSAHRRRKIRRERAQAEELCSRLLKLPPVQQGMWITEDPAFQSWAAIERLGEMSARAASANPARARELAAWAKGAAESRPEAPDRSRCVAYAGFFLGNALRVSGKLREAQATFAFAWEKWQEREVPSPPPFAPWRPYELEAALRIDQQLWPTAIDLVNRALSLAPTRARTRLLLKKASCLQFAGAPSKALPVLTEAVAQLDAESEPFLAEIAHFTFAACLFDLGRPVEAELHINKARTLAIFLGNDVHAARCEWLGARISAGRGEIEVALATFARVREVFAAHGISYDYAAVALHEAIVLLEIGETFRAKKTAAQVVWTFTAEGIAREAKEALEVFCKAAQCEKANLELATWALHQLQTHRMPDGKPPTSR